MHLILAREEQSQKEEQKSRSRAEALSVEWMNFPETTGAQHTQGKHHWTQSRVSRYWPCVCVGLYFSLADSCFRRLWPQFHRGHLLIKGKDWNSQVLSVCAHWNQGNSIRCHPCCARGWDSVCGYGGRGIRVGWLDIRGLHHFSIDFTIVEGGTSQMNAFKDAVSAHPGYQRRTWTVSFPPSGSI